MRGLADRLSLVLSEELIAALEEHIHEEVAQAVQEALRRQPQREWLPLAEAAERYGCTPRALQARARRGTVQARRQGRLLYVHVDPSDNGAEVP